jgi:type IV pilus assembly protein PilX
MIATNTSPTVSLRRRGTRLMPARQRGFSLIVSLMMLIVIIILGISGSQMAINEERGSRADRDRQIAFQAAEAAIKDAEQEIYGAGSPACTVAGIVPSARMRQGTGVCFTESFNLGYYAPGCSSGTNAGLCAQTDVPIYLDPNVQFVADAKGSGNGHTVAYGTFTGKQYGSQVTLGTTLPVSAYPPRYVIEHIPKNTSLNGSSDSGGYNIFMWRVTAIGFGANPNTQVMLQAAVATNY